MSPEEIMAKPKPAPISIGPPSDIFHAHWKIAFTGKNNMETAVKRLKEIPLRVIR